MTNEQPAQQSISGSDPDPDSNVVPTFPVVDAHVHVFPERLLAAISEWFETEQSWSIPTLPPEVVVERIQRRTGGFVFFPYAHRPGVSTSLNEVAAEWQSRLDHAVGLGTVHAGDDDPARVVADAFDAGLQGVKLHCPVQGFVLDDERLDPVYEALVARDAPLVAHASTHPFYRGDADLGAGQVERVLDRFPGLRICIPHLGLFEMPDFLDLADRHDDLYFDTSVALDGDTHDLIGVRAGDVPVDRLRDVADRVMFGTDYPVRPQRYGAAFGGVSETFPEHERDVFYRNAQDFFGTDFGI